MDAFLSAQPQGSRRVKQRKTGLKRSESPTVANRNATATQQRGFEPNLKVLAHTYAGENILFPALPPFYQSLARNTQSGRPPR